MNSIINQRKNQLHDFKDENEQLQTALKELERDNMTRLAHIIWAHGTKKSPGERELILSTDNQPTPNLECSILVNVEPHADGKGFELKFSLLTEDGPKFHEVRKTAQKKEMLATPPSLSKLKKTSGGS